MIDPILETVIHTLSLMVTSIIVVWFAITTIVMTAYTMKTNHLNAVRITKTAFLFLIVIVGLEGSKLHYIVSVLHRPITTPNIWILPTFTVTFFACLMLGQLIGFLINKSLDFFYEDFWLNLAKATYSFGDGFMVRSHAFNSLGITSMKALHQLAAEKKAEQVANELKTVASRAASELEVVAGTAAEHLKETAKEAAVQHPI